MGVNQQPRAVASFQALMMLRRQARVHVRFMLDMNPSRNDEETLEIAMQTLGDTVLQLMQAGPRVRASVEHDGPRTAESKERMDTAVRLWLKELYGVAEVSRLSPRVVGRY